MDSRDHVELPISTQHLNRMTHACLQCHLQFPSLDRAEIHQFERDHQGSAPVELPYCRSVGNLISSHCQTAAVTPEGLAKVLKEIEDSNGRLVEIQQKAIVESGQIRNEITGGPKEDLRNHTAMLQTDHNRNDLITIKLPAENLKKPQVQKAQIHVENPLIIGETPVASGSIEGGKMPANQQSQIAAELLLDSKTEKTADVIRRKHVKVEWPRVVVWVRGKKELDTTKSEETVDSVPIGKNKKIKSEKSADPTVKKISPKVKVEGDYECDECGKRFSQRYHLHQHSYVHVIDISK